MASKPGADGFPQGFLPGVAISTFQSSGDPHSNWGHWERRPRAIAGNQKCGLSCDFYNRYEEDIKAAAALGCRCFRFSLEWSRAEPRRGGWDEGAFERFERILLCMKKHGLEPVVTLHHFVHPQWFEDIGAFERMDNIPLYLRWVEKAFTRLGKHARLWLTFNEPSVYTFFGYVHGTFPPGKRFGLGGTVLRNLMAAHCVAYHRIKELPGGADARVGIVHNWMRFEPRQDGVSNWMPHVRFVASTFDHMWNWPQLEFLQTGTYDWRPLGPWRCLGGVRWQWPGGRPPLDWVGLNYYSRVVGDWALRVGVNPGETATDMDYSVYPEGFRKAIDAVATLGVPIYVTETGISDARDDRRAEFIDLYMSQVEQALRDGLDVRGLMYWSLTDNFEWAHGFRQRFGLFEWNDDGSQRRELRQGARGFPTWCQRLRSEFELSAKARAEAAAAAADAADAAAETDGLLAATA